jgi:hypothetical protein
MVYGLGNRGAELLERCFGVSRRKVDWTAKNRVVNRYFLEHTLAVADVMVAFEVAANKSGSARIVYEDATDDIKWKVLAPSKHSTTQFPVIPDKVFKIELPESSNGSIHILLEVDRATMPVVRSTLKQTSVYRKLIGYQQVWRQRLHAQFGMPRIRVLTVTTTAERVTHLLDAARKLRESTPGLFLFTHKSNLTANNDLLATQLVDGEGKPATLAS